MLRIRSAVVAVALLGFLHGSVLVASALPAGGDPDASINEALGSREYARAVELIDAALPRAEKDAREYLLFRAGLALLYDGYAEQALTRFDQQLAEFPAERWADKARFRKADAHVALKQFAAAERIYAERVQALVGDARKAEIAKVYLKFADEYFTPREPLLRPDYEKARAFYTRALELEPGEGLRDELLVKQADCLRLLGKLDEASAAYESYLLGFDPDYRAARKERTLAASLPPAASQTGQNIVAARLNLARCRLAKNQPSAARRECQDLLSLLAKIDAGRAAQRPTWIEATYLISKSYGFPKPADAEALTAGVQTLTGLIEAYPENRLALEAAFDIGQAYAQLGRYEEARTALHSLITREHVRPTKDEDLKRAEELAQDALFTIGQLHFGQKKYADAIRTWNEYVAKYPAGPHWSRAQQAVVDAEYQIGTDAVGKEDFATARQVWTAFLEKYPLDRRAAATLYAFGDMTYREQLKREQAGELPDWSLPIAEWRRLVAKYPQSEEAGQAQLMIARTFEDKLLDLEAALAEYKKVTQTKTAPAAKVRIDEMNATRLAVRTERVFRTNEPAKIRVDARNVEKLTVRLYHVDPRDYFRKRHGLGGVEALDLFLIDPGKTMEVPIEGFAKYKPCTQEIEIPFDGPGVYAVNVSNDASQATTAAGTPREKIEATTLLIRSDIDVIIKSSRRQVLVFTQNMATQSPAGGVDVLVSNGTKVVLSGKTGEDGVWLGKSDDLKNCQTIAVLAEYDGHVAGNALALQGLEFSQGLGPRGYLYTDRPVYRPGEAVNIRGILREIKDGQYVVPMQPEDPRLRWKLDVVDAKGRVLRTDELRLTEFGSFASQFRVAEDGAVGEYKLIARRVEGPTFAGTFAVQTYEMPKAILAFDLAEPVVQRGEPIKGALVLKYAYGEPVVGKTVEYSLAGAGDKLTRVGVTDKDGKVAFEFDSAVFAEEAPVLLQARQADLNVGAEARAFVAVRAFRAVVKTPRELYLAEEPVEATVETRSLKGEPMAQEMTVTALRITRTADRWSETKVAAQPVKTDAKDGLGRVTFKLVEGGEYRLRAEGQDRFGHVVTAEGTVQISDDKDKTRLRLFSDRQHYKVGEKIELDIHSRLETEPEAQTKDKGPAPKAAAPATFLALVTYEGEEIIGYRTLTLAKGHNPLELPVENAHFPNFAVGVAVMAGNRFHEAAREFTVERQLNVALWTDKPTYRPRDEMTVEVAVTDQQGQPVQAEVGLAMIDGALLSRYPDGTPNIIWFFQNGAERQAALRTQTSCTFRYVAKTRPMVTELLAEARREELLNERVAGGVPVTTQPAMENMHVLELQNANAAEVSELLESLLQAQTGSGGARGGRHARVTASDASHSLVITGDPKEIEEISKLVEQIDVPASARREGAFNVSQGLGREVQLFRDPLAPALPPSIAWDARDLRPRGWADANGSAGYNEPESGLAGDYLYVGRATQTAVDESRRSLFLLSADKGDATEVLQNVNDLVRNAPPRTYFPDVAYWNPRIVTDAGGKATVKVVIPDSSTAWKLVARGVTPQTLCGQAEAQVVSKHDFFVEVLTPATLVEGDETRPRAAVHCLVAYEGKVEVALKARRQAGMEGPGGQGIKEEVLDRQTCTVEVSGAGTYEVEFAPVTLKQPGALVFEVTAKTAGEVPEAKRALADASAQRVDVTPWGMRVEVHAAGVRKDTDFVELELPQAEGEAGQYHDAHLTVAVGPSMQCWLIEEALESGARWAGIESSLARSRVAPPRTHADAAAALLATLYAADYVRSQTAGDATAAPATPADLRLLNERAAGLVAQLLAAQTEKGGWTWCGQAGDPDPWTTAYVAWGLGKARAEGLTVADTAMQKLTAYLRQVFADARTEQTELKAIVLHGLSWLETVDFAHANRLYRNRETLSAAALAHLALTCVRLERTALAADLLGVLEHRMKAVSGPTQTGSAKAAEQGLMLPGDTNSAWMNSELEVTALTLLAQLSVDPRSTNVPPLVAFLTRSARADGWRPHKAAGAVVAALATYYARGQQAAAKFELAVSVNGREVRKLNSDEAGSVRLDVGANELKTGRQRVDFALQGRGEYAYAVTLSGFSRAYPKPPPRQDRILRAENRRVTPPPLEYKGRTVPAGFSTAQKYEWFTNTAKNLPVGAVASVAVRARRDAQDDNAAGDRDYVIVKETIPAGFRLLSESVQGGFQAYDLADNVLTLYYGSRRDLGEVQYKLVATTPGTYRLPPTIVQSLYRPEVVAINQTDQVLTVLPRGTPSPDEYKHAPDELFALGKLCYEDGQHEAATKYLQQFLAGDWLLHDQPYREAVHVLLLAALARQDADAIVNYFEILKERYPDLVIPFDQIVQVAEAYARTGQHERAYLIYRATADASFVRESQVAGALQGEGWFLESVDFLESLWRTYPDTPQVESIGYALSQTVYAQAARADRVRPRRTSGTAETRRPVRREELIREAIGLLDRFLTLYPASPIADEASYSLASAYLDLDDLQAALVRAERFVTLFPKSKWLDRYRYIQALAYFHLGDFEHARALAEQVAAATYRDEQGVERPSPNKWLALYIIGQIYHAQNQAAQALAYYKQVKEQFGDAGEAVSEFERKSIRLPEVTIFHPDQRGFLEADEWDRALRAERANHNARAAAPGANWHTHPFVQLDYRNIQSAVVQVYRVDLLKLALVEKNLTEITAVNLAGISPLVEKTVPLGEGLDYIDKSLRIELDQIAAAPSERAGAEAQTEGAYLVICRGDDLFTSGLVLVTPLALEVQADAGAQRTRVRVVDAITRDGRKDVHVKVIGTGMNTFVTGDTDLRGVFSAESVSGYPTAVARDAAGHFAFYRSEAVLALAAAPKLPDAAARAALERKAGKADYLSNVQSENRQIQMGNQVVLDQLYQQQQQRGVEVKKSH